MKRMSLAMAEGLVCEGCVEAIKTIVKPDNELSFYDQMELVKSFCNLEDRMNASARSEAVVTPRTKTE